MRKRHFIPTILWLAAGCTTPVAPVAPVAPWRPGEADWPPGARTAVYTHSVAPGFDSPEAVTNLLERRWSPADIQTFCIPQRRHNDHFQNLMPNGPEVWKGRLYAGRTTGFDKISWYGVAERGRLTKYSLGVERGRDFWLLEFGYPDSASTPPDVAPDPSDLRFIGWQSRIRAPEDAR